MKKVLLGIGANVALMQELSKAKDIDININSKPNLTTIFSPKLQ
jgi:hypothetical protein